MKDSTKGGSYDLVKDKFIKTVWICTYNKKQKKKRVTRGRSGQLEKSKRSSYNSTDMLVELRRTDFRVLYSIENGRGRFLYIFRSELKTIEL
jgi:hypothetical protein